MSASCLKCGSASAGPAPMCLFCGGLLFAGSARAIATSGIETDPPLAMPAPAPVADAIAASPHASSPQAESEASVVSAAAGGFNQNRLLAIGAGVALLIVLSLVGQWLKPKGAQPVPARPQTADPAAEPSRPAAKPAALDARWLGTWRTADGKRTMEFTARKIAVTTDEWKRTPQDETQKFDLKWTANEERKEGEFGFAGRTSSPAGILRDYEKALAAFKKDPTDYRVTPQLEQAHKWIAWIAPGEYQVLHGYAGTDDLGWKWIADEHGNMLEVLDGHYGFHLNLLQRVPSGASAGLAAPSRPAQAAAPGDAIPAPVFRVGDTYTYETLDFVDSKLNNVTIREVVEVSPDGFVMSFMNARSKYARRLSYDRNMSLVSTRSQDNEGLNYSPAIQYFKFPLRSGETWNASSTETNIKTGKTRTHALRGTVGNFENVTTPAGTFRAIRITLQSELNDEGKISTGQDVSWYAPEVRRTVMSELQSRDPAGKEGRRRVNLLSYQLK